jgi:hypothetical protein
MKNSASFPQFPLGGIIPYPNKLVKTKKARRETPQLRGQNSRSLMIEVNSSLYMNEISGERLPEFLDFKSILLSVVSDLIVYVRKKLSAFQFNKQYFLVMLFLEVPLKMQ